MKQKDKYFSIGFAAACSVMLQEYDEPVMVEECFKANFMSIKTMVKIGVDSYDITILTPIVKEIERKNPKQYNYE